jgi:polyisoprenoid-binding protein YceI
MVISEVDGQFDDFEITAFSEKEDLTDASINVKISTKSVNTHVDDRDNHLRSADFFDAENFPYITFVGESFTKLSDEKYKLTGDLTIKDITKPIELDATFGGKIKDPWGNTRIGLNIKGSLNRFDYNLKWNALIETGGAVVGKTINFNCDVEFTKVEEK